MIDGYVKMSRDDILNLGWAAIVAIEEEKNKRIKAAICNWRSCQKPNILHKLKLVEYKTDYTDEEVMEKIRKESISSWNFDYYYLVTYGDDLIERIKKAINASLVSHDNCILIEVSLADSLRKWSNKCS